MINEYIRVCYARICCDVVNSSKYLILKMLWRYRMFLTTKQRCGNDILIGGMAIAMPSK